MPERTLRLGAIGLGRAFSLMLPTFVGHPRVELVAGADPRAEARQKFAADFGARAYASAEELCADPAVEAVYISTPHPLHAPQTRLAAAHGKHILVEKPMALTLADCEAMIETAAMAGVQLVVGHSHSFDAPVARTRELVASGAYGSLRMIQALNYTDWLYRPRRADELTEAGGGVMLNQAPHQVDSVRLIGGGRVRTVRASAGLWDLRRPTYSAYAAHLTFESGVFATLAYNGNARFDSDEFTNWIGESGQPKKRGGFAAALALRERLARGEDESAVKAAGNYGGPNYRDTHRPAPTADQTAQHQHFGLLIASCDGADLRPQPQGVMIYDGGAPRLDPIPPPTVPRSEVIDEFHAAVVDGKPPLHSGAWSLATIEVCLAMIESAKTGREVVLSRQIGV
jgi:phthalate 4,5-cis-dihydrodiol dehydrogenase